MSFKVKWSGKLKSYMDESLIVRAFRAVGRFFGSLFKKSLIVGAFSSETFEERALGGFFSKILFSFFGLFERAKRGFLKKAAEDSLIICALSGLLHGAVSLPVYGYGIAAMVFSIVYAAATLILFGWVNYLFCAALFIFGALLLPFKTPTNEAFAASLFGKMFFKYKKVRTISGAKPASQKVTLIAILALAAIAAAAAAATSLMMAGVLICGLIYVALLIKYPETGFFTAIALAPFLPTMVLAGLLGLTVLAFILKLLFSVGYSFKTDSAGVFSIVYAAMLLVCALTSYTRVQSLKIALLEILFISSYFLVMTLIDSRQKVYSLVFVYLTSSLFTGFYGIYQYLSGMVDQTWVDDELFAGLSFRVYSTFENPNVYGEYLLLTVFLAFAMVLVSKKLFSKLYYLGVFAVLMINLALTYSRGCYLALIFGGGIFILFAAKKLIAPLAGLFAGGIVLSPWLLPKSIIERFLSIANLSDSSTSYRINIWRGTVRMLKDFWAIGTGLGRDAFNVIYPRYALSTISAPHAHSLYLQMAAEMGIGGLVIFLGIMFCFLNSAICAFKAAVKVSDKILVSAFIASAAAFLFESIFEYTFYNYRVFLIFFMFLGIANAFSRMLREEKNG